LNTKAGNRGTVSAENRGIFALVQLQDKEQMHLRQRRRECQQNVPRAVSAKI
jgi:hypothetical protein